MDRTSTHERFSSRSPWSQSCEVWDAAAVAIAEQSPIRHGDFEFGNSRLSSHMYTFSPSVSLCKYIAQFSRSTYLYIEFCLRRLYQAGVYPPPVQPPGAVTLSQWSEGEAARVRSVQCWHAFTLAAVSPRQTSLSLISAH